MLVTTQGRLLVDVINDTDRPQLVFRQLSKKAKSSGFIGVTTIIAH